jgi:hypothetical protein
MIPEVIPTRSPLTAVPPKVIYISCGIGLKKKKNEGAGGVTQ